MRLRLPAAHLLLVVAVVGYLDRPAARAQSSPFLQRGAPMARDTHTAFPYEHVDPLSGNLLLVTTDLALPGNAGVRSGDHAGLQQQGPSRGSTIGRTPRSKSTRGSALGGGCTSGG